MHRKYASASKLRKFSFQKITIAKNKTASINHIIIRPSLAISVRKRKKCHSQVEVCHQTY